MSNTRDYEHEPATQQEVLEWLHAQAVSGYASDFDLDVIAKLEQLAEDYFHT